MPKTTKPPKQLTFDNLKGEAQEQSIKNPALEKEIVITQMAATTGIDEVTLKIGFKLLPSIRAFSKVKADLFFDKTHISSALIRVLQGPLATDESEYSWVLEMKDVPAGTHCFMVEMYELWSTGEKLNQTSRELKLDYIPQTRQSRMVRIPTIKSVVGADLAVVSGQEKSIYSDILKTVKKEKLSERDNY
jgi:hypothetical protein